MMIRIVALAFIVNFMMASCSCKKPAIAKSANVELLSGCPTDGSCKAVLIENRKIKVEKAEFGGLSYDTVPATAARLVVFRYERKIPKGVQDGFYNEELILELSQTADPKLQKALYGRFCYCKGETGYYEIDPSKIHLKRSGNEIRVDFGIAEVHQVITGVTFTLK